MHRLRNQSPGNYYEFSANCQQCVRAITGSRGVAAGRGSPGKGLPGDVPRPAAYSRCAGEVVGGVRSGEPAGSCRAQGLGGGEEMERQ